MSYKPKSERTTPIEPNQWEEADKKAGELASAALFRFLNSGMYATAKIEGWGEHAFRYAREMIDYQARTMAGCNNVGLSAQIISNWDYGADEKTAWQRLERFKETCRRNISEGHIQVSMPSEAVAYWKTIVGKDVTASKPREREM